MTPRENVVRTLDRAAPLIQAAGVLLLARLPAAREVLPALGLFTGPFGTLLLVGAALLALRRTFGPRMAGRLPGTRGLSRAPAPLLFALSTALGAAIAIPYARSVEPSGDEIDYLLMAQSVWREGDLDLRDNFERGDHLEYLGGLPKMPGGFRIRGRYYPTHAGGFAVVLAPAYALGGRVGCVVLLVLLASGLGLLVRDIARTVTGDEDAALWAWLAAISPPALFYSAFLYTEIVIAFCIALALRLILGSPSAKTAMLAALALSVLPWVHVRTVLVSGGLGGVALFVLRGRARRAFVRTALAMAAVFVGYLWTAFGTLSPFVRYGGGPPPAMTNATPGRTLVGLFVDGAYGLLPHAPVYLLALAAVPLLIRSRTSATAAGGRAAFRALASVAGAALLPVLFWRNWWGFSPPARFLVPLVPVLAVALAARLAAARDRGLARWRFALLGLGLALAAFLFAEPSEMLMIGGRSGTSHGFDALAGDASLSRYLPFLSSRLGSLRAPWEPPPAEARVALLWLLTLAALVSLDALAVRRARVDRWFSGLALPLGLFFLLALAVDRWARV